MDSFFEQLIDFLFLLFKTIWNKLVYDVFFLINKKKIMELKTKYQNNPATYQITSWIKTNVFNIKNAHLKHYSWNNVEKVIFHITVESSRVRLFFGKEEWWYPSAGGTERKNYYPIESTRYYEVKLDDKHIYFNYGKFWDGSVISFKGKEELFTVPLEFKYSDLGLVSFQRSTEIEAMRIALFDNLVKELSKDSSFYLSDRFKIKLTFEDELYNGVEIVFKNPDFIMPNNENDKLKEW